MFFYFTFLIVNLVIAMEDAPTNLYPPLAVSAYSFRVVELIHRSLFRVNQNLEPEPDLVETYSIVPYSDGITIFIRIKQGLKTCSGRNIDSQMVLGAIQKYKDYGRIKMIRSFRNKGDYEILIDAEKNSSIIYELMLPVFPENWTDCTGDFEVVDFSPGYYVLLRSRVNGRTVLIKGVKNDITRVLEFEKGDIDILVNAVPPHLFHYVSSLKNIDVFTQRSININYIALNTRNPFLSKKEVRQAIFYAIDREKIINEVIGGQGDIVNSLIPSVSPFYCDCARYKYDPKKSVELIESAGFQKKNGYFFKLVWKTSTVKYAIRNVKAISSYLEKVGIKIEILPQEFQKFFSDIVAGNYDIFSLNIVGVKSPDIFRFMAHSDSFPPKGANRTFFSNPYFDQVVEQAERSEDFQTAKRYYTKAQEILMEECPYIPIYQIKDIIAYRTDRIQKDKFRKAKFVPGGSLTFINYILD